MHHSDGFTMDERVERMRVGAPIAVIHGGPMNDSVSFGRVVRVTATRIVVMRDSHGTEIEDWFPKTTLHRRQGGGYHNTSLHLRGDPAVHRAVERIRAKRFQRVTRDLAAIGIEIMDVRRVIDTFLDPDRGVHGHHANESDREAAQRLAGVVGRLSDPLG